MVPLAVWLLVLLLALYSVELVLFQVLSLASVQESLVHGEDRLVALG